ncbi:MAG: hypothetical protein IJK47_06190 [Lachnospiraceae bacterium]|nr:hypothetical protein [Lachnospiraceae bacterium]
MPKTKKRNIVLIIAGVFLFVLCAWRFWPHPFSKVVSADLNSLTEIQMNAVIYTTENGSLKTDIYKAGISSGDENWDEILKVLTSADYRQDFRNPILTVLNGLSVYGETKAVFVQLRWGEKADQTCVVEFLSNKLISVIREDGTAKRLYHPSNHNMLNELAEYIQKNKETK